jgi:hypothetical protein
LFNKIYSLKENFLNLAFNPQMAHKQAGTIQNISCAKDANMMLAIIALCLKSKRKPFE